MTMHRAHQMWERLNEAAVTHQQRAAWSAENGIRARMLGNTQLAQVCDRHVLQYLTDARDISATARDLTWD